MRYLTLAMLALVAQLGCTSGPREIVILHTNDMHGRFLSETRVIDGDTVHIGGMAALSGWLDSLRQSSKNTLYLDAGDLMTGNPICDIDYAGLEGGALLQFLVLMRLDAMELGNHEFDKGLAWTREFVEAAPFPVICSNLVGKGSNVPAFEPYVVLKKNGLRIGVIGLLLADFADVVVKTSSDPFDLKPTAQTVQKYIDELDPQTDLLIVLSHCGLDADRELAKNIHGADIILSGHSHVALDEPEVVNGIYIAHTGSYCRKLGVLRCTIAGDTIQAFSGEVIPLVKEQVTPNAQVAALSDSIEAALNSMYGAQIATVSVPLTRDWNKTSNLGNLLADELRKRYDADVAYVNSGGIRKDLEPGPVTRLDVIEMLPFQNSVITFEATGDELMKTARQQARVHGLNEGELLQMSGMTIRYRKQGDVVTVDEVRIGGELLVRERTYKVVSHDYITASQPDQYLKFHPRETYETGELFSDVIMQEMAASPSPLQADARPRMEQIR